MATASSAADVSITREQLTKYFHLPITDVAKELGICATMLKKICRKNGIPRWPHRKIKSLNKMIDSLEASLPNDGSEAGECIRQEIIILKNKKSLIMRNPSILVQGNAKRSSDVLVEDNVSPTSAKKLRPDLVQPVTTFNNPKAGPPTAPNSFSINQLLTPPTTFTPIEPPSFVGDEKDYRAAYMHHHSHLFSPMPSPFDKQHMDGRMSYPSSLTSYLPSEDDNRHADAAPLPHPSSTDPYYYHKALAFQYHYSPRQMLPPTYPPHLASPLARNPYYPPPFSAPPPPLPSESPRQLLLTAAEVEQQQAANTQQAEQNEQERSTQNGQPSPQAAQPKQQSPLTPRQPQTPNQESLPKMNIPPSSSDVYKFRPASPPLPHTVAPFPQPDLYFYPPQYPPHLPHPTQQPRLPQ